MTDIVTDVVAPDPTQRLEPDVRRIKQLEGGARSSGPTA